MIEESTFDFDAFSGDANDARVRGSIFSPVFVIGINREQLASLRRAYDSRQSTYDVHFYAFRMKCEDLVNRVGMTPRTILLGKHVQIAGELRTYIRRHRIPVLRVLDSHCPQADLPAEDFYGGVYGTISELSLGDQDRVTSLIDLGIRVFHRDRDRDIPMSVYVTETLGKLLTLHERITDLVTGKIETFTH